MKKTLVVAIALIATINSFGQEFLGIKVDGKKDAVISAFKSKGFKVTSDITKDVVQMEGEAAGKKIELAVVCSPTTKTVWKFSVYLPAQSSWSYLKGDYENYLKILTEKYGQPKSTYNFFMSPYDEGDGYEMTAVYVDKCRYSAYWPSEKGVSIKITKWKQVNISYENPVNSALDDKEQEALSAKTF